MGSRSDRYLSNVVNGPLKNNFHLEVITHACPFQLLMGFHGRSSSLGVRRHRFVLF